MEYFLEIVECKFARKGLINQLKICLTNIVKNIIWHLFPGESHQVVKIIVTYQCILYPIELSMVRGRLNCMEQDDPELVQTVKERYLDPPSTLPYNFQVFNPNLQYIR